MLPLRLLVPLLLLAAAAAAEPPEPELGLNLRWSGDPAAMRERFRRARALGVRQVRLDWEWRAVEAVRGQRDWRALDRLVRDAAAERVALLPIVHYAPAWALPAAGKAADCYELAPDPARFADYADFLLASVRRYGPGGTALAGAGAIRDWQVWNEPNIAQFWGPRPDPAGLAGLMRAVEAALAPVRSRIRIVHAGLSRCDVEFMHRLWAADPGYGARFDVFAVHSYVYDARDGVRAADAMDADDPAAAALGFVGSARDPAFLGKVFNLRLFLELRGAAGAPLWITEMGYFVADHALGVDERGQAERLRASVDFVRRRLGRAPYGEGLRARAAGVERLYWFALEDYPAPEGPGLGNFGLYRPDGSLRPAGAALRELAR